MELKLINLGRNQVNQTIKLNKPSYSAVLKEVKKHILSKHPDIEETEDPHVYDVFAGFRPVGQIWVEIPECMAIK